MYARGEVRIFEGPAAKNPNVEVTKIAWLGAASLGPVHEAMAGFARNHNATHTFAKQDAQVNALVTEITPKVPVSAVPELGEACTVAIDDNPNLKEGVVYYGVEPTVEPGDDARVLGVVDHNFIFEEDHVRHE